MYVLRIEHRVSDFETWKRAFDSDPIQMERSGVRRYRILRSTDDRNYVLIDLDFDSANEADAVHAALRDLWRSPRGAPVLAGSPQSRVAEVMESKEYRLQTSACKEV